MKGLTVKRNLGNKFTVVTLHYTADPRKRRPEWVNKTKEGMPIAGWRREYEIDYSAAAGSPVLADFRRDIHVKKLQYNPSMPLLRGWDFGYHYPCIVYTQYENASNTLYVLHHLQREHMSVHKFLEEMWAFEADGYAHQHKQFLLKHGWHPGRAHQYAEDFCGVDVTFKSDKDERATIDILNAKMIYPRYRLSAVETGLELIRSLLRGRENKPQFYLNEIGCEMLIDAFGGAYYYPEWRPGRVHAPKPCGDGLYEHGVDGVRYILVNILSIPEIEATQREEERYREWLKGKTKASRRMGY